jgi:hypothetical protein
MNNKEEHFEITEIDNLIDNLEMVAHFLGSSVAYKWKWAAIALHQALYGALIAVLQGTDFRQTVVDRKTEGGKALMLHVNKVPVDIIASSFGKDQVKILEMISHPYLISLDEALRRSKDISCLPALTNAQPLKTNAEEEDSIQKLTKEFRNEFEHFSPKAWIIFTSGMPDIFQNVLRVIGFLVLESNCIRMSPNQELNFKTAFAKAQAFTEKTVHE